MLTDFEIMLRLGLSVILGGLIGLERQMHRRPAGLRTHILVSLGSCLMMLTSLYLFGIYNTGARLDISRMAAGVITGIGFLGAGAIMKENEGVKGLTTAASVWVACGIGIAIGSGFYTGSIFCTVLALIVLFFLKNAEGSMFGKDRHDNH